MGKKGTLKPDSGVQRLTLLLAQWWLSCDGDRGKPLGPQCLMILGKPLIRAKVVSGFPTYASCVIQLYQGPGVGMENHYRRQGPEVFFWGVFLSTNPRSPFLQD
jgi:hypothetical protein